MVRKRLAYGAWNGANLHFSLPAGEAPSAPSRNIHHVGQPAEMRNIVVISSGCCHEMRFGASDRDGAKSSGRNRPLR